MATRPTSGHSVASQIMRASWVESRKGQATVSQMHLYVDDVDATYHLALREGATSLMAPMRRPHGDQMAGFVDPTGNFWWVASSG